jgi:hypothetical protein
MTAWKFVGALVGLLVIINGTEAVVRALVRPPQPDPRKEASRKLMEALYKNSDGKLERLTPEQKAAMKEFRETGIVSNLNVPTTYQPPSKGELEKMSARQRLQALYNKSNGNWSKLTAEEQAFIRKQMASQPKSP